MLLLPILEPLTHASNILLEVLVLVAPQLLDDAGVVALPRLVQNHLHDLALHILLHLVNRIATTLSETTETTTDPPNDRREAYCHNGEPTPNQTTAPGRSKRYGALERFLLRS